MSPISGIQRLIPKCWTHGILLALILAMAFFLRIYSIENTPPGIYPDEALNANEAVNALETGVFKIFYETNNGREGLFINLIALSFSAFGIGIWQLKLVSTLVGALTVLGIYLLIKAIFSNLEAQPPSKSELGGSASKLMVWTPLLATFFLATSFWHINFSRISFRAILTPLFLTFAFWMLFVAIKKQKWYYFAVAGIICGLGFYTYPAFRIALLLLFFAVCWHFFKAKNRKKYLINLLILFSASIIILSPLIIYSLQHQENFSERANQISVFRSESPYYEILKNTTLTLGQFSIKGDCNWRHDYNCQPLLFWPIGIFFIIGIFLAFKNIRRFYFAFLLFWFFISLLPAILTNEGIPHSLRSIGSIIPAYVFAALGFIYLLSYLEAEPPSKLGGSASKLISLLLAAILAYSAYFQIYTYFNVWAKSETTKNQFNQHLIEAADYLNSLPDDVIKYVVVNTNGVWVDGVPIQAQTIKFMTYGKKNIVYLKNDQQNKIDKEIKNIIIEIQNNSWKQLGGSASK